MATIGGPAGVITRPIGLDMTAAMLLGAGAGLDLALLVDVLPAVEAAIVSPDGTEQGESADDDA